MELWKRNSIKIFGLLLLCLVCVVGAWAQNTGQTGVLPGANGGNKKWVRLAWTANAGGDNVTGYNIYRTTTSGSGYTKLNTATQPGLVYRDDSVVNGNRYYYAITAVNVFGESTKSAESCVSVGGASC